MKRDQVFLILSILLGIFVGLLKIPFFSSLAKEVSDLFVNILKLITVPLVFLSIITTMTNLRKLGDAKVLLKRILVYTLITTLIAALVSLALFYLFYPVSPETKTHLSGSIPEAVQFSGYSSFLRKIFPSNFVQAVLENNVIGIALIAAALGIAIQKIPGKEAETLSRFFSGLFSALLNIAKGLIKILPIGLFAFTIQLVESFQGQQSNSKALLMYSLCVVLANVVQGVLVLPLLLKFRGVSPLKLFKAMYPAIVLGFFAKSSNAALPTTLERAKNKAQISEGVANFSFPLCTIINMNGCAAFILLTVLFISFNSGLELTFAQILPWVLISCLAAVGNAGVPMGCYFLTGALLVGQNIPLDLMSLILPIYSVFDMVETALNIWSDCCVSAIVDKELKQSLVLTQKEAVAAI